jgi:metal-responsive CopG/Arc/MetJ family transcriptional regulator
MSKKRTKLEAVTVYLPADLAAEIDRVRGKCSRANYIRDRLAKSLKTARPDVKMGRPKSKPPDPD